MFKYLSLQLPVVLSISLVYVRPSGIAPSFSSSYQLSHQSMLGHQAQLHLSLALASYLISLCYAIRLSSISLQLLLAISLVYVRPLGLAPSLSRSCQLSHQFILGCQAQLHLSLVSLQFLFSLPLVSLQSLFCLSFVSLLYLSCLQ